MREWNLGPVGPKPASWAQFWFGEVVLLAGQHSHQVVPIWRRETPCHSSTHSMTLLGTFDVGLRYSIGPYFHINSLLLYFKDVKFLGYFNLFAGTVRNPASLLLLTFSHGDPDQLAFLLPSPNFFLGLPTHYFQASQSP